MKETKFTRYPLKTFIYEGLKAIGFYEPTDIQKRIIPKALKDYLLLDNRKLVLEKLMHFFYRF